MDPLLLRLFINFWCLFMVNKKKRKKYWKPVLKVYTSTRHSCAKEELKNYLPWTKLYKDRRYVNPMKRYQKNVHRGKVFLSFNILLNSLLLLIKYVHFTQKKYRTRKFIAKLFQFVPYECHSNMHILYSDWLYLQSITEIWQFSNNCLLRSNTSSACSIRVVLMTRALCAKAFAIALTFWAEVLRSEPRLDGIQLLRRWTSVVITGVKYFLCYQQMKKQEKLYRNHEQSHIIYMVHTWIWFFLFFV